MIYLRKLRFSDLGQHIGWHPPQTSGCFHGHILDGDLCDYASDVATMFRAGEVDRVADAESSLGLLSELGTIPLHSVDHATEFYVSPGTEHDR